MYLESGHARSIVKVNGLYHLPKFRERGLAFHRMANRRRFEPLLICNQFKNEGCVFKEFIPEFRITLGAANLFQRLLHCNVPQTIEGSGNASGILFGV